MGNNQNMINAVTARAATDGDFRKRLLSNPNQAISEVTGTAIPSGVKIKFVEKDATLDALVVLPDFHDAEAELSAEELETVAGGNMWCDNVCVCGTATITKVSTEVE